MNDEQLCGTCGAPATGAFKVEQDDAETLFCAAHEPPPLPARDDGTPGYAALRTSRIRQAH